MFEKQQVERILATHGLSPTSPDDDIRSLLMRIEWHKDDIEAALIVLRENTETNETYMDSLHQVFRRDERLHPETIKSLLGIDVTINALETSERKRKKIVGYSWGQVLNLVVTSLILALVMVIFGMWYMNFGIFI